MTPEPRATTLTRAERLDRLPFTRRHTRLVVGSGIGWALDAMDVRLASFVMAALAVHWGVIGYLVVPSGANGWRWAFAIGAVPAFYAVVVRRARPESVRFLESTGRYADAEEAARQFEIEAGVRAVDSRRSRPRPAPERARSGARTCDGGPPGSGSCGSA